MLRVMGLAVLPEFRCQGIARGLLGRLAAMASDSGCGALALHTVVQTGNVAVFGRLGFRFVKEQTDAYFVSPTGEPLTEAYMECACPPKPLA